jgi:hypothetical protein
VDPVRVVEIRWVVRIDENGIWNPGGFSEGLRSSEPVDSVEAGGSIPYLLP